MTQTLYRRAASTLLALMAMISALPAIAAPARPAKPVPPAPPPEVARVALTTAAGIITVELDGKNAPITVGNFLRYVDQRRFDGTVFYRAMRLNWGTQPNGLVQGGTQNDPKRILKPIAHESTSKTGILHKAGTISMARWAPGTATGDFSILLSDMDSLDAQPQAAGDNAGYAAFGRVVDGMDVVRKIFDAPISPTKGEGVLKGQMLAAPVKIINARRVAMPKPVAPIQPSATSSSTR
jgi:peptidyl-prolyl cis-trans isomerase A (cyclophilin A)